MPYSAQTLRLEDAAIVVKAIFVFKSHANRHVMYETEDLVVDGKSLGNEVPKGYLSASKSLPLQMYSIGLNEFAVTLLPIFVNRLTFKQRYYLEAAGFYK